MGETRPIAATGAVIVQEGRILLVRRAMPPEVGLWIVPAGRVEWGETWHEAVRREVLEETGLRIEVGDVAWVGEVMDGNHHFAIVDFFATVEGGELQAGSDAAEVRWVALDEAADLEMPDSMRDLIARLRS
jgi:ADP-ribose pyrophosphatase YjhB (NUDIX family)